MSIYLDNPWKPVKHTIFKDEAKRERVHDEGFLIMRFPDDGPVETLTRLFEETHEIKDERGGLFYSVYSRDLSYRKKVHEAIGKILHPFLEQQFKDYKIILNSFVVKASGPKSEFYLHQDTTGLDERKFSCLNLWIPLEDVDENNGALALVPRSHRFFSPYRSISFPAPFDPIQQLVRKYLEPVRMKKGEVLVFDNRLLHNSFQNLSGKTRAAVVCGIFPQEAALITCHKQEYVYGEKLELIEHDEDFLLTYPKFLIDCQDRPHVGRSLGFVDDPYHDISEEEFALLCEKNGVKEISFVKSGAEVDCNLIAEPDHKMSEAVNIGNKGFLGKIKKLFKV